MPIRLISFFGVSLILFASTSYAASREECVEAHGRGQELREKGQLSRARQTFLSCAQSACPLLVQQDCSRFAEELAPLVPSVTFSARDSNGSDLSATAVLVDDMPAATHLDDGRSYEFDPGKHTVKFVHDTKEVTLNVVLNQGERGRLLAVAFADATLPVSPASPSVASQPQGRRGLFPLVVAGLGGAALATGTALFVTGLGRVPSRCSASQRECAAPPDDPMLAEAESGMNLANLGIGVAVSGGVALLGGLVWYFVQPRSERLQGGLGRTEVRF